MDYFPIFIDIKGQKCLLVGGGSVAYRKAVLLNKAGAELWVVAPEIDENLKVLAKCCAYRAFAEADLNGCRLVVAATNDERVNRQVSELAQARQLPVNVVDSPEFCSFVTPSIVEREPITVAISSGGSAPVLARSLRARIEALLPANYGKLAALAGRFRAKVKTVLDSETERRRFWERIFNGPVAEQVFAGSEARAEQLLVDQLDALDGPPIGEVYLVGAGPGDPELLTLKALRLMQQADVVLYDRLVSPQIMELVRRDAERIYVGKRRADHAVPQMEINQQLVDLAKAGKRVLRLKGGDPFIFGRGGEEIELLAASSVSFQVVPGITAASGCAAYAGIPLTHRDYAQSVRFITGHLKDDTPNLNFKELAQSGQTLVFYMGLMGLAQICQSLIAAGRAPETPAALIEKGTTAEQRVLTGDLSSLPSLVACHNVHAPTLVIIGEVVCLHKHLKWFGQEDRGVAQIK